MLNSSCTVTTTILTDEKLTSYLDNPTSVNSLPNFYKNV